MQIHPEPVIPALLWHTLHWALTFQASLPSPNHRGVQMPGAPWSPWILFKLATPKPAYSASPFLPKERTGKSSTMCPLFLRDLRATSGPPLQDCEQKPPLPFGLAVIGSSSINALNFKIDSNGNTSFLCY